MIGTPIRIGVVGAGYFSQFHLEAWNRLPDVQLVALCDQDDQRLAQAAEQYQIPKTYQRLDDMLAQERLDAVDVITPPATHLSICQDIAAKGLDIICQKPLAPTYVEAQQIAQLPAQFGIRIMVHENFRFQPWYRTMKQLWQEGVIGRRLHQLYIRTRMGDGWPVDAYMNRQPYFRHMPRLLVYETGIHFLDVCRYLGGEVKGVFATLSQWNPRIKGEDAAMVHLFFEQGGLGMWDANRFNEPNYPNPRYTFGEITLEADEGTIRIYPDGRLTVHALGKPETDYPYLHTDQGFAGDCVYATQQHFIEGLQTGAPFETDIQDYLNNLLLQEAVYQSHLSRQVVDLDQIVHQLE